MPRQQHPSKERNSKSAPCKSLRCTPEGEKAADGKGNRDFGVTISNEPALIAEVGTFLEGLSAQGPGVSAELSDATYIPRPFPRIPKGFLPQEYTCDRSPQFIWTSGDDGNFFFEQLALLNEPTSGVLLYMQYFSVEPVESQGLLAQMAKRRENGGDVRVLLSPSGENSRAFEAMAEFELPVRPFFAKLHGKLLVTDHAVVIQTKDWAIDEMAWTDCGIVIQNSDVADYYRRIFDFDWQHSEGERQSS